MAQRIYVAKSPEEIDEKLQLVARKFRDALIGLSRTGLGKVLAEATVWSKRSLRGQVSGRDKHLITGNLMRSVAWEYITPAPKGSSIYSALIDKVVEHVGRLGTFGQKTEIVRNYAQKIANLDTPGFHIFGIEQAIGEFENYINNADIEGAM